MTCGPALARIPIDSEGFAFDIAQPAQLIENRPVEQVSGFGRACRDDNRDPMLLCRLLRTHGWNRRCEQQTETEIAPSIKKLTGHEAATGELSSTEKPSSARRLTRRRACAAGLRRSK